MRSLFATVFTHTFIKQHDLYNLSTLRLLSVIYWLPLPWRKFILTACRVQQNVFENPRLYHQYLDLSLSQSTLQLPANSYTQHIYDEQQLLLDLNETTTSVLLSGLLSYFVRAEAWSDYQQIVDQREESIKKELDASQQEDQPQQLNYNGLFSTVPRARVSSLHVQIFPTWHPSTFINVWRIGLDSVRRTWISQQHVYMPTAQANKNLSTITMERYNVRVGLEAGATRHITQADILRHYHLTGEMIPGPPEVRVAWRYNDLKPRVYYCGGGDSYWTTLFIKDLSYDLLSILPSTNPKTRFDTSRVTTSPISEDEILVTYDYSSFTTSLSELKFFLHYLGKSLIGLKIQTLDVYSGVTEVDVGEYFLQYNNTQNVKPEFDVSRLLKTDFVATLFQLRSGMLGVNGNINFSTLLHGTSLGDALDSVDNCVVGDDALFRIVTSLFHEIHASINTLGVIEASKFSIWSPKGYQFEEPEDTVGTGWQFLKRPLDLTYNNEIIAGVLPSYPNIAEFLIPDDYHISTSKEPQDYAHSLASQWGSFLHRIHRQVDGFTDVEALLTIAPMIRVYTFLGLDYNGMTPGSKSRHGFSVEIFVPPVTPEVFETRWESILSQTFKGTTVTVPRMVDGSVHPGYLGNVGSTAIGTTHRLQRVTEMLGYLSSKVLKEQVVMDEGFDAYLVRLMSGYLRPLKEFTVLHELPSWYNQIVALEDPPDSYNDLLGYSAMEFFEL